MNSQMFNSFLDGTKPAIESAAIANACGLDVPEDGLAFPPCGVDDLAHVLRPREVGGQLERRGMVETVSSLERDGRPVFRDLRWGVYVVIEAPNDYAAACSSFCPGQVYRWDGEKVVLSPSNCLHCMTCAVKCPLGNIEWLPPEGGEGPRFAQM